MFTNWELEVKESTVIIINLLFVNFEKYFVSNDKGV